MRVLIIALLAMISLGLTLHAQEKDRQFEAADQSLMIIPTAYTMPKGASTFTDYEIFIVQYAYGVTGRTHLSIGMPFPIVVDAFDYSALGIKQNYLRYKSLQCAFNVSWMPKVDAIALSNVVSYGTEKTSVHAFIGVTGDYDKFDSGAILALGYFHNLSKRAALISELISYSALLDEESSGIWTIGIRIKGDRMSWDLGGFRPFGFDTGPLLLVPLIKLTVLF